MDEARHDAIEADAWEDLYAASGGAGIAERVGGALILRAPGLDHLLLNRVIGWGVLAPATREELEAILRRYDTIGARRFFVHASPSARPAEAHEWLAASGLARYERAWVKLSRGRGPVPPVRTDVEIRPARLEEADAFGGILARAFDLPRGAEAIFAGAVARPGWITYVAADDGELVGAGLAFAKDGSAYLAGGATAPSHRRRGVQAALLERRIIDALDLGCERIVTETGEAVPGDPQHSFENLVRLGLAPAYARDNYAPRDARWRVSADDEVWHDAASHEGRGDVRRASGGAG